MRRIMRRIGDILHRLDAFMTLRCSGNPYLWDWWQLVRSPITYIILAAFFAWLAFHAGL